jgi:hypothetical protein
VESWRKDNKKATKPTGIPLTMQLQTHQENAWEGKPCGREKRHGRGASPTATVMESIGAKEEVV